MTNATIQCELVRQMTDRMLKFNVHDRLELEEVLDESAEYIMDVYGFEQTAKACVSAYLDEFIDVFPEHIERLHDYIQPIAA